MNIAYSYGRFSDASQALGDSKRRQLASARKWCDEKGYLLSNRQFFDAGKSGFYGENFKEDGALTLFINEHKDGKLEKDCCLLIDSADRFSRLPTAKAVKAFLDILYAGVNIAFCGSLNHREVITVAAIEKDDNILYEIVGELKRAYRESAEKSRKVKAALDERLAQTKSGLIINQNSIPKYYAFLPLERHGRKGWKGKYVQHKDFAPLALELVNGLLSGRSMYEMAADFNARNIPSFRTGGEWHRNSVRQLLINRSLVGEYQGVANYIAEPLLDEQTFLKVQNVLNNNHSNKGNRANLLNVFRGLCFCAECGKAVTALSSEYKGVPFRYLRCSNYGNRSSCTKAYLRLDLVEREFFFNFLAKDPYKLINGEDIAELKAIRSDVSAKVSRQSDIGKEIEATLSLVKDIGAIPEFKAKLMKLEKERSTLSASIDELNAKAATIQDIPKDAANWFVKVTHFGEGENGEDITQVFQEGTHEKIAEALKDNETRAKLRLFLPSIIGKIVLDSKARNFAVYNRTGRKVYQSGAFESQNNNTERWRQSLTQWTQKKDATGKKVTVKRYASKYYQYKHGKPAPPAMPVVV
jgi:hypothetical protein